MKKIFFSFKGDGPDILLYFEKKEKNLSRAGAMLVSTIKDNMQDVNSGNRSDSEVNGHPATFVIHKSTMLVPVGNTPITNIIIEVFAMNGSVCLKKGALSFASIYSADQKQQWETALQKTFRSIRKTNTTDK